MEEYSDNGNQAIKKLVYTSTEVMNMTGWSKGYLYKLIKNNRLPAIQSGHRGQYYLSKALVDDYIAGRRSLVEMQ